MRNPTHFVVGACATLGLGYITHTPTGVAEAAVGAATGLLPNVDYLLPRLRSSRIGAVERLANRLKEGGVTHSVVVMTPIAAALGLIAALATGRPGMAGAVIAGVLSHILLDTFGTIGVQLWAPISEAWCAFPPWVRLRPHRGGTVDVLIFAAGLILLVGLAIPHIVPHATPLVRSIEDWIAKLLGRG